MPAKQEIPNEMLERKKYLVCITIVEARNIQGLDAGGTSDPFVKVRCAGQEQQTQKKYEVNSCVWNQTLTFDSVIMNNYELETFEMVIELFDHNALLTNELIGQYSIGLSTLYRALNHEFYKNWIGVFRKDNPNKVQAYLLISCFLIGPGEMPPSHPADDNFGDDLGNDSEEDEEEIKKKIESIKRAQGVMQILTPNKINKSYQLTIMVDRAEALPEIEGMKPFVSARVFGMVQATGAKMGKIPKWYSKLCFPIYYPVLNNKITMRLWYQKSFTSNIFVASIPEHPSASDPFNLTKLLASDGRMPARWINLYGTHPQQRSSNTTGRKWGSQYLGRILIAFSLVSNEKPQLSSNQANPMKEPRTRQYQLWVDLYDLINCEVISEGSPVWAVVSIGSYKIVTRKEQTGKKSKKTEEVSKEDRLNAKWKEKSKSWKWKEPDLPALRELIFPQDLSQIPDIFVDLYTEKTLNDKYRFGYLRLKARDCISLKPKPAWYRLSSPYNDTGIKNVGMIMANFQLLRDSIDGYEPPTRIPKRKEKNQTYRFFCQIIHGFELATSIPEKDLKTKVEIRIGDLGLDKPFLVTSDKEGRFPQYHFYKDCDVKLQKDLTFEADMRITVKNIEDSFFGQSEPIIGEFAVPCYSILNRSLKPQFFNILNEEGQFRGQILCNFYIISLVHDLKLKKLMGKKYIHPIQLKTAEEFNSILTTQYATVNIHMAAYGLRNLVKNAQKPYIEVKLTHGCITSEKKADYHQPEFIFDGEMLEISTGEEKKEIRDIKLVGHQNPNFFKKISIYNITLVAEPLLWPYLQITVKDEANEGMFGSGAEECFTTLSLLDFIDGLIDPNLGLPDDIRYAAKQLS